MLMQIIVKDLAPRCASNRTFFKYDSATISQSKKLEESIANRYVVGILITMLQIIN
jgi:hypothetical protein